MVIILFALYYGRLHLWLSMNIIFFHSLALWSSHKCPAYAHSRCYKAGGCLVACRMYVHMYKQVSNKEWFVFCPGCRKCHRIHQFYVENQASTQSMPLRVFSSGEIYHMGVHLKLLNGHTSTSGPVRGKKIKWNEIIRFQEEEKKNDMYKVTPGRNYLQWCIVPTPRY